MQITVEPRLTVTLVIRSPCYNRHFFGPAKWQNHSYKNVLMRSLFNMANGYMLKFQRGESRIICIGNSMICGDIWHKYHE